jgi:hypothetical protein
MNKNYKIYCLNMLTMKWNKNANITTCIDELKGDAFKTFINIIRWNFLRVS